MPIYVPRPFFILEIMSIKRFITVTAWVALAWLADFCAKEEDQPRVSGEVTGLAPGEAYAIAITKLKSGTTIGHKRILLTNRVSAVTVKLSITGLLACPVLNGFGLYDDTVSGLTDSDLDK